MNSAEHPFGFRFLDFWTIAEGGAIFLSSYFPFFLMHPQRCTCRGGGGSSCRGRCDPRFPLRRWQCGGQGLGGCRVVAPRALLPLPFVLWQVSFFFPLSGLFFFLQYAALSGYFFDIEAVFFCFSPSFRSFPGVTACDWNVFSKRTNTFFPQDVARITRGAFRH